MQTFLVLFVVLQLGFTAGFSIGRNSYSKVRSTSSSRSVLKASTQDGKNRVQIKKIVDALSSGTKSGAEIEEELKALQTESRLLEISTGVAGSLIGLVAGTLLDGALAGGNAPWSAPVGFVLLGGAVYYGAVQKSKEDVADFLQSALGQPVLKASKSAVGSIKNYVDESKAAAVKKIEDTVEEINRVPTSIIKSIVDAKDDAQAAAVKKVEDTVDEINRVPTSIIKSIVDAKDDAVTRAKLIPTNIQTAASRSYEEAKQGAINKVDQKVSELKAIPVNLQARSTLAAKNAQAKATEQATDLANVIRATPGKILDAAVLKAEGTAADIAKIPQIAATKVSNAYEMKKQEISDSIDKNVQSVKNAVDSIIPSEKAV